MISVPLPRNLYSSLNLSRWGVQPPGAPAVTPFPDDQTLPLILLCIGSGARIINICYFDQENDWWVAKHIRKPLRSTITTVDWHPNNILLGKDRGGILYLENPPLVKIFSVEFNFCWLIFHISSPVTKINISAAGSTDFKVRVFSTYIKEIEPKPAPTEWGAKMPFANLMAEFSNSPTGGGWIHSVGFNQDGTRVAWVGHDSSIAVADAPSGMVMMKLKLSLLPLLTLTWISPTKILAAGHDCVPVIFLVDSSGTFLR